LESQKGAILVVGEAKHQTVLTVKLIQNH